MKKFYLLILSLLLFKIGCADSYHADITVRECITTTGETLQVPVEITINGETKTWEPGSNLTFNSDIGGDLGFIEVNVKADGYTSLSPELFEVEQKNGLELILMFTESDEPGRMIVTTPPVTGEVDDDDNEDTGDDETDPERDDPAPDRDDEETTGTFTVRTTPADLTLFISRSGESGIQTLQTSQSSQISLSPGDYEWTAQSEGYRTRNGVVRIEENTITERTIMLEEEIEQGSLEITTVPADAEIEVINSVTDADFSLSSGEIASLPPGNYRYRVSMPGYFDGENRTTIESGQEVQIVEELVAISVNRLVDEINSISTLSDAIGIYENLPDDLPALTISQRINYVEGLYRLARHLEENNERDRASDTLRKLLDINPRYIEARWLYSQILTQQQEYDQAIGILRPTMGAYSNDLDEPQRTEVRLRTRYQLATTYFDRYESLDTSNINERQRVGDRALSALSDFIERFQSYGEPEYFRTDYETARIIRRNIMADLGR